MLQALGIYTCAFSLLMYILCEVLLVGKEFFLLCKENFSLNSWQLFLLTVL